MMKVFGALITVQLLASVCSEHPGDLGAGNGKKVVQE